MKLQLHPRIREAGYSALFITLVLVTASLLIMGATLTRSTANTRLNDRNALYISGNGAAEAAVEKVIARMMIDFANGDETYVYSNLNTYATTLLPTASESPYWNNFIWSDGQGHDNQIYVARTSTSSLTNEAFVQLENQFTNLSGYSASYRVLANARMANSSYNYNFTNAVQQDVQLATIPIFQFAIFYNGLLEFSDAATLVVNGPVHANSNIYVGSPSSLTFNAIVTATGTITDPGNVGILASSWTGAINYNGLPAPGYLTHQPTLTLPIGTNSTSSSNVQQILYPPQPGDSAGMSAQRYYNKAGMVIMISNTTYTVTLSTSSSDPSPVTFNGPLTMLTNTTTANYFPFLSTTTKLFDQREQKWMELSQIDVGKLTNWMQTNLWVYNNLSNTAKFNASTLPLNIVYIGDWRTTNSSTNAAIRLYNGANLPAAGLTIATPNPLYVQGLYNCPAAANQGTTNVIGVPPASFACDAWTVLSPNWNDSQSTTKLAINATSDTIDAAVLTGNVPSTGTNINNFSGGVQNFPRLLENWSGQTLTLNTSLVCLFSSTWATGVFVQPGQSGISYYNPPSRNFNFNQNYAYSSGMPPGTPNICRLIRSEWCNPPPGVINGQDVTLGFVPH